MESEPLCDLLALGFEPTDTGLQAYALPATAQNLKCSFIFEILMNVHVLFSIAFKVNEKLSDLAEKSPK